MSTISEVENLQSKLLRLKETPYTKRVLLPLFSKLYPSVDHHGGPYEHGKDIIFWKCNEFGDVECGVAQVKKVRPTVSTRKSSSFSDILYQLEQAMEKTVPALDGKLHLPKHVLFITPCKIDTRALQSNFEKYSKMVSSKVRILDGNKIAELLLENCPAIAEEFLGHEASINNLTLSQLNNDVLMRALRTMSGKSIQGFYCDLAFSVGKKTHTFLQTGLVPPVTQTIEIGEHQLEIFSDLHKLIRKHTGIIFVRNKFSHLFHQQEKHRNKIHKNAKQHFVEANPLTPPKQLHRAQHYVIKTPISDSGPWSDLFKEGWKRLAVVERLILESADKKQKVYTSVLLKYFRIVRLLHNRWDFFSEQDRISASLTDLRFRLQKLRVVDPGLLDEAHFTANGILILVDKFNRYIEANSSIQVKLNTNIFQLVQWFQDRRRTLLEGVAKINARSMSPQALQTFLRDSASLFELCDMILDSPATIGVLAPPKQDPESKPNNPLDATTQKLETDAVIQVPISDLFASHVNFAIFGGAGAGKTTTLQMYAKHVAENNNSSLVLFVPLATAFRGASNWEKPYKLANSTPIQLLLYGIANMLSTNRETSITPKELDSLLLRRNSLLLLDGIDEVIKDCPWILTAMAKLPSLYTKTQVITSSRDSGEYIRRVPFLGLTIREFTKSQQETFVTKWFELATHVPDGRKIALQIISHLQRNEKIAEIVRNPLSATILCVLGENNLPLPEQEIQLYKDRMRLLLGEYDIHKQIRRIESHPDLLHTVAVKLAFSLHLARSRQSSIDELKNLAVKTFERKRPRKVIELAVEELVNPCNVLVPMNFDAEYGFGHLRFQEYLAACELYSNRNIDVIPMIYEDWWRGPLVLLAQMSDDLEFIWQSTLDQARLSDALPTLNAILKDKSPEWIQRLDDWIKQHPGKSEESEIDRDEDAVGKQTWEDRLRELLEATGNDFE